MANLEFKEDLKLGNSGEKVVIDFLTSKGCELINTNNDNKYDIKVSKGGKVFTYEIKTDLHVAPLFDSGNIFIEFSSRKKPSGVSVTEADWFVTYFINLNELWFIKTDKLKELIANNNFRTHFGGGDIGSETNGYLINRKQFKENFHVCKI